MASKPLEKIFLDIVGHLTAFARQNTYIITIQCDLTKFAAVFPLVSHDANNVAKHW